ncbi:MAG: carbohydrate kinase [Gammaproteobacteria bacterium]|jgi:fructokinase
MSDICVFGEVLFDHFPDGKRVLGGAPFNVAWHLKAFGLSPTFISRVGKDTEGEAILDAMEKWGMETQGLQIDDQHPTGRVTVEFIEGEPSYDIVRPSAWDAIEANRINNGCSMLYHGTLALRDQASLTALEAIRSNIQGPVFVDVNLRSPWWDRNSVLSQLVPANWVKLNSDELALLSPSGQSDSDAALQFIKSHRLDGLILTHGGEGAEILTASGEHVSARPEADIAIVDTVGAGDAFASVILLGLAEGWPLRQMLERAQSFASRIVGRRGATVSDPAFYRPFIESWHLHH